MRRENCSNVDHISSLPDDVISHIPSFVPTKSAVMTSVLSKRWKYTWTKVPVLDFTKMPKSKCYETLTLPHKVYFKSFVNMVLLYNEVSYIQRFCLNVPLRLGDDTLYVKSWIGAMARLEIREIDISLNLLRQIASPPVFLPKRLLSERLVLKLVGNISIFVRKSLHLPCLETIHLLDLYVPSDQSMKRLLLSCRALKDLSIDTRHIGSLYVESLTLEKLVLSGVENEDGCIFIKAPNLRSLDLGDALIRYDICDLCVNVEAHLEFFIAELNEDAPEIVEKAFKVLEQVSRVKTLS